MLSESSSLFYRPKDKKMHADQARQNFVRTGGDHFTLLNVWEQWADTNYSQQFCYEQFLQFKSLSRARDIRDQLAGLCERVEVVIQANPNSNDITAVQKALTAGYFYNAVSLLTKSLRYHSYTYIPLGPATKERRFVQNSEDESHSLHPSIVKFVSTSTACQNIAVL